MLLPYCGRETVEDVTWESIEFVMLTSMEIGNWYSPLASARILWMSLLNLGIQKVV